MFRTAVVVRALPTILLSLAIAGCDEPPKESEKPKETAKPAPTPTPAPAPTPKKVERKPSHPCPDDSEGKGTFDDPCVATGATRIMEVKWNGKIGDKGPTFRVINNAKLEVMYGRIVVYFYDKAGKQLDVMADDKKQHMLTCGGNIFAGPMKPGEKAFLNFSCIPKDSVPEDATAIEGELQVVGFTGDDGKKADTYWKNDDLVPKERPKGGIKAKKK